MVEVKELLQEVLQLVKVLLLEEIGATTMVETIKEVLETTAIQLQVVVDGPMTTSKTRESTEPQLELAGVAEQPMIRVNQEEHHGAAEEEAAV